MTTSTARDLLELYRNDDWHGKPHDMEHHVKALGPFIKKIKEKEGGLISLLTEQRVFKEYLKTYILIMKGHVTYTLKTVSGLKRSMFAATYTNSTGHSPSDASKGQNVWLLDAYGEFPEFTDDFEALTEEEQGCCVFLQKYTRDLMLYFRRIYSLRL